MAPLGFVGLGTMGGRMAKRLLAAGARSSATTDAGKGTRAGRGRARAPEIPARGRRGVGRGLQHGHGQHRAARDRARPDGVIAGLRPGAVWAEMSTVSPDVTRELGRAVAARGAALIDAPVSGSPVTLDAGQLSFMVGGDPAALEKVRGDLMAIGRPSPTSASSGSP